MLPFLHIHKGDFLKPGRKDSRDKGWGDIVRAPVARPRPGGDVRPHVRVRIRTRPGEENQGPTQFYFLEICYVYAYVSLVHIM